MNSFPDKNEVEYLRSIPYEVALVKYNEEYHKVLSMLEYPQEELSKLNEVWFRYCWSNSDAPERREFKIKMEIAAGIGRMMSEAIGNGIGMGSVFDKG